MSSLTSRLVAVAVAVAALAASAGACPTCSVGQHLETLAYVLGFLLIPYVVVTGALYWMRKITAQERGL